MYFQKRCANGCNEPVRMRRAARDIEHKLAHAIHHVYPLVCSHSACYALLCSRHSTIGCTCPKGNDCRCILCKPEGCTCHGEICARPEGRINISVHKRTTTSRP